MIENDTIRLLRECDSGVRMGITSIDEVLPHVKNQSFRKSLEKCRDEHSELDKEIQLLLNRYHDEGKAPNPVVQGMSWIKTNVKLIMDSSDNTIADLMTDGCNMGVKSLNRYLNEYEAAEECVKDIAKRLINQEERLSLEIRECL